MKISNEKDAPASDRFPGRLMGTGWSALSMLGAAAFLMGLSQAAAGSARAVSDPAGEPGAIPVLQGPLGGWSPASADDAQVRKAAVFALSAQAKALRKSKNAPPVKLKLVKILKARQQVVAGTNYEILMRVNHDGVEKEAKVVVWWQAWRQPEPYRLTSWDWVEKGL